MLPDRAERDGRDARDGLDAGAGRDARDARDVLGPGDLMELASDVGPAPLNVGALLVLDATHTDPARLASVVAARARGVPRLSQRLVVPRARWRRPYWEDAGTPTSQQVGVRACPAQTDGAALLAEATLLLTAPLPAGRPPWRAHVLTGLPDGRCGLVVVMHHVLADGIGGLAVLAALADDVAGAPTRPPAGPPAEQPPSATHGPGLVESLRRGLRELGGGRPRRAPATSLNRATGRRRAVVTAEVELAALRAAARRWEATVNDVLLVAVTQASAQLLAGRGERPPSLVVSVPVSSRPSTTAGELGNQVGVMPVRVPLHGSMDERVAAVAAETRERRAGTRGASAQVVGPVIRGLAAVGLLAPYVNRQRLVNLFVTNMRGPAVPLTLGGAPVERVVPLSGTQGNVGLAFAALSYAGRLTVSAVVDPDVVPETERLAELVQQALDGVAAP